MKCDIIIPIWNQLEYTRSCIVHIVENTRYPYRLILVDNGSDVETKVYLESLKESKVEVKLIRNERNMGFIKAINQGLKASDAPYVCILNNDTTPGAGWLTELVEFARKRPGVGLLNPLCNGHIQRNLTVNGYAEAISVSNKDKYMEMNQCQGFCMLIKRELIDKIGYLDEQFGIGGFDDTDYSIRAYQAGFRSVCVYSAYVYHREHKSFDEIGDRKKIQLESEKRYFKKWPRHRRVVIIFSISKDTDDKKIGNFLGSSLFLAREWCWVNLLVFGGNFAKEKVKAVSEKINFPLHQNIKFNYLNTNFKILEIAVRIMERSFGTKRRKKYDAVVSDEKRSMPLLRLLCSMQRCSAVTVDFNGFPERALKDIGGLRGGEKNE